MEVLGKVFQAEGTASALKWWCDWSRRGWEMGREEAGGVRGLTRQWEELAYPLSEGKPHRLRGEERHDLTWVLTNQSGRCGRKQPGWERAARRSPGRHWLTALWTA